MSKEETTIIHDRLDNIEKMIVASRDMPQSETISKLFYAMDKKLDILIVKQEATHEQACKTNGRVNAIELWKATLNGKIIAYTSVIGVVVAFVTAYLTK